MLTMDGGGKRNGDNLQWTMDCRQWHWHQIFNRDTGPLHLLKEISFFPGHHDLTRPRMTRGDTEFIYGDKDSEVVYLFK